MEFFKQKLKDFKTLKFGLFGLLFVLIYRYLNEALSREFLKGVVVGVIGVILVIGTIAVGMIKKPGDNIKVTKITLD